ncbi:ABA4-like family protein [Sphingorhabdus sp. Alg239-R122]|uniref:ABA4-like family protein n=1 Tax=Sphingorhabdus sp. Alg239-R122 TaxID=2305989 RepID=UPI0013DB7A5F|nr:ABA4-like family protein [Sphingorhabdus sp. Alg239-R122]
MWDQIFSAANMMALICWAVLILLPRSETLYRALFYGPILVLGLTYLVLLGSVLGGAIPSEGDIDFGSIAGVRSIFDNDVGVVIGWIHYLCFDLFVGLWIARNADAHGINRIIQAPILVLTFMFGPVGLVSYMATRQMMRAGRIAGHLPA